MDIKNEILWRIYLVALLISLSAVLIFVKAAKIQTTEGDKWRAKADSLYLEFQPVNAVRGNIIASDGSLLATSLPMFEVRMDTRAGAMTSEIFKNNLDSLSRCLATLPNSKFTPGGWRNYIREGRKRGDRFLSIRKAVTYPELTKIKKFPLFNRGPYKGGLIVLKESKRLTPFNILAHRTIGYVRENAKPVGLEGYFNDVLGGEQGQQLMQKVAGGKWIPVHDITTIEPKHGKDIKTTLNINIQDVTENALMKAIRKHDAESGCAIVMEVKTGKILSLANIGKTEKGTLWETYNYAVGATTEPGSTFKLASMMALLEDGYIELSDSIDLHKGDMTFGGEKMEDASFHMIERTTVKHAFERSSNVGIAQLVNKHYKEADREERFIKRLKQFHLNQLTGIEIEGEGAPYIKEAFEDNWSGTTIPWMSIGYELRLTPLQTLTLYNAIANDGKMMKPYLVTEIQDNGRVIRDFHPTIIKRQVVSKNTVRKVQELLVGAVENGTAKNIKTEKIQLAGKTGTAILDYSGSRAKSARKYQASFAGYFPADNPKYSCIVLVSAPRRNGFYGSQVAAPVFREIADKCFATDIELHNPINKGNHKMEKIESAPKTKSGEFASLEKATNYLRIPVAAEDEAEWVRTSGTKDSLTVRALNIEPNLVPDVRGMALRDGMFVLGNLGMNVESEGSGKIVRQSITPGTRANRQNIKIKLQ